MIARSFLLLSIVAIAACPSPDEPETDAGVAAADAGHDGSCTTNADCPELSPLCFENQCVRREQRPDAGAAADAGAPPVTPTNACTNDTDVAAHQETYGPQNKEVGAIATDCAISCFMGGRGTDPTCLPECMTEATGGAVSGDCLTCYALSAGCVNTNNCAGVCLANAEAPACVACRCGESDDAHQDCYEVFAVCSGFPASNDCGG